MSNKQDMTYASEDKGVCVVGMIQTDRQTDSSSEFEGSVDGLLYFQFFSRWPQAGTALTHIHTDNLYTIQLHKKTESHLFSTFVTVTTFTGVSCEYQTVRES